MNWHLQQAVRILRNGGVLLHATEGVWGLSCDPWNRRAVARLLGIKRRPFNKGLILVGGSTDQFAPELAPLADTQRRELLASWPGPVSWVVPNARFPAWITGGRDTVVVRVPGHEQTRELAEYFGGPLVSTSANRSRRPAARNIWQARQIMGQEVDYLLPGRTGSLKGPSVISELTGTIIRAR